MSLQRVYLHILALMVMLSCATGLLLKLSDVYVSEKKHLGFILQHMKIIIDQQHLKHLKDLESH